MTKKKLNDLIKYNLVKSHSLYMQWKMHMESIISVFLDAAS